MATEQFANHEVLPECLLRFDQIAKDQGEMLEILRRIDCFLFRGNGRPPVTTRLELHESQLSQLQTRLDRAHAYVVALSIPLVLMILGLIVEGIRWLISRGNVNG